MSFYTDKNWTILCIQRNYIYKIFMVSCEKCKTLSFISSIIKNIVIVPSLSKFAVKLIYWIALGSVSRAYSLLKSIAINL